VQSVTAAKLIPLLILVVVGAFAIKPGNLSWPGFPATTDIARTSMILIFAFMGVESALTPSGEVKNPARTVPRAIAIALIAITLLYIAIQVVTQGILGPELAADNKAPLAEAMGRVLGDSGKLLILVGAAISTFGFVAGDMLASPRGLFALGRDGLLPSAVGKVHDRYHTPHVAIVIHAVAAAALAISGSFAGLVALSVLSTLIVYLVCCLATIKLQKKNVRTDGAVPFSVPGGPVIPILATGMIIWLMTASTRQEFIATSLQLVILTAIFLVMRFTRVPLPTAS
jgi:amino acid transporter